LQLLGVTPAAIERLGREGAVNSLMSVVSTLSGVVVERKLAQGQVVQPADALFVVADLSSLWAVAQVPEQQVSRVKEGQSVIIEVPALGNEKLWGKLVFVGQTVDPDTRTVLVRTALDNRDGRLKPAMLASVLIEAKPSDRLVIPAAAVVRENDIDHLFIAEAAGAFRLVKVKLGVEQGGQRVVLTGLKGDERIVIEGAFHLNNERNRKISEGS
jgi:cobalt-zinc-cadmium efflux system membrane fusion protein